MTTSFEVIQKDRKEKLEELKKLGITPYPPKIKLSGELIKISQARKALGKKVLVAGRIWSLRKHGGVVFVDLKDGSGKIQLLLQKKKLGKAFDQFSLIDVADFFAAKGKVIKTPAGETTVDVEEYQLLSKAIRVLPSKWYGLKDVEERYRQRYVDLLLNEDVLKVFITRTEVIKYLRKYLDDYGFLEVETPILQSIYGGALAKPFITHHNALDCDFYLRISDELYLKRLIVGGIEKVYEIGKDFRNEGMDRAHNPEFTMLEFYWAYVDYEYLMKFTESMLANLVKQLFGTTKVSYQGKNLDFAPPWPRITYREAILKETGIDIDEADTEEKIFSEIKKKKIEIEKRGIVGYGATLDALYKKTTRPKLVGPLFLTERPTEFVTLAKRTPNDPRKTASFQLLVAGEEVINAYNELNDPQDQAERWRESEKLGKKGKEEHEAFDEDYIRALEYGMPPTAGWGMGIDRLTAILTNQPTLKDTIIFPTLRPEK
ncbi:lysine--tRNA ligase [Candidatus Woesebacteria bacterium RIFOXYA1_FULL_40_18]|uniref:Lysine--tRNA ligase n=2 Tax=Candidatus Woeseibacteriota TaxID=1752722 RepID=A0A1F8CLR0_9BACT|nr:MAG: lysine--tRNA ligase [Candidatus Woesebacteria bacterium RIFOXYA1_FULL_40_18]OGM80234.1 MAG: lysine--tRNA ligase [Candidatus Woesebacteria bacterium RIFOXYB1_FULL_40_26]